MKRPAVAALVALLVGGLLLARASVAGATPPSLGGSIANATTLSGAVYVAVSGNYAYTLAYYAGTVTVVDISNPAAPRVVGQSPYSTALLNGSEIVVSGTYAYVVSQNRNGPSGSNINDDGTGNSMPVTPETHTRYSLRNSCAKSARKFMRKAATTRPKA